MMEKFTVTANPKCKNCLGSGVVISYYVAVERVCSCVTEQLRVIIVEKDHRIPAPERYTPRPWPEFVKVGRQRTPCMHKELDKHRVCKLCRVFCPRHFCIYCGKTFDGSIPASHADTCSKGEQQGAEA